jgi:Clp amino terminal domain, pathogenicity island component
MTPGPNLQELIDTIRADAGSDNPLAQLATASATVTDLSATGDAALGYFVDRARGSGHSWVEISSVLGVSKQAAHKRFSVSWTARPAFDRYTDRTKNVIDAAAGIALARNHGFIGTEHLLLAFYAEPRSIATKLLTKHDITEQKVADEVSALIPDGMEMPAGTPPYTPRAYHVFEGAVAEALELGHNYVGTEHLLLAFYRDSAGVAATVLNQLGLTADAARAGVIDALSGA